MSFQILFKQIGLSLLLLYIATYSHAQNNLPQFKFIAFYTANNDPAHISFVHEANRWFPKISSQYNFIYDSTDNWDNLNPSFLSKYDVVIFLDIRPELPALRDAFKNIWTTAAPGWDFILPDLRWHPPPIRKTGIGIIMNLLAPANTKEIPGAQHLQLFG